MNKSIAMPMSKNNKPLVSALLLMLALSGCAWNGSDDSNWRRSPSPISGSHPADPVPRHEPLARRGNPPKYKALGKSYRTWSRDKARGYRERGIASWYGRDFHGKPTSSGEPYDMMLMTAAHKHLPIPCYVRVTHRNSGRSIIVRVNDRGPFVKGRIIDLSYAAAHKLGMANDGIADVEVALIDPDKHRHYQQRSTPVPAANNNTAASNVATTAPKADPVPRRIDSLPIAKSEPIPAPAPAPRPAAPGFYSSEAAEIGDITSRANSHPVAQQEPIVAPVRTTAPAPTQAQAPQPTPNNTEPAPTRPAQPAGGSYFVQITSLTDAAKAVATAEKLNQQGFSTVQMVGSRIGNQAIYRLRVGPIASEAEARAKQQALARKGYPQSYLVRSSQ